MNEIPQSFEGSRIERKKLVDLLFAGDMRDPKIAEATEEWKKKRMLELRQEMPNLPEGVDSSRLIMEQAQICIDAHRFDFALAVYEDLKDLATRDQDQDLFDIASYSIEDLKKEHDL